MYEEGCGGGDLFDCCRDLGASFICQSEPIRGTMSKVMLVRHEGNGCDAGVVGVVAMYASMLAALER